MLIIINLSDAGLIESGWFRIGGEDGGIRNDLAVLYGLVGLGGCVVFVLLHGLL